MEDEKNVVKMLTERVDEMECLLDKYAFIYNNNEKDVLHKIIKLLNTQIKNLKNS